MITTHGVLSINQNDIIDWLKDNGHLPDYTIRDNFYIRKLKPTLMNHIANTIGNYIVESGAYDDALQMMVDNGDFEDLGIRSE